MIKQVLILAASVCGMALVIAIMSGESAPEPAPAKPVEEVKKVAPIVANTSQDDEDYYSDEDDDFVFGEPVKYSDGDDAEPIEAPSEIREATKPSSSYAAKPKPRGASPTSGALGSKENPVDLTPDRPRT